MIETEFRVRIMTPETVIFTGVASGAIVPIWDGLMGILPGHDSLCTPISVGVVRVAIPEFGLKRFAVGEGFLEIQRGGMTKLVVEVGEPEEQVDRTRAMASASRARKRLASREHINTARAEASLLRALTRLSASDAVHCRCCLVCTCTPQSCKCSRG